MTRTMLTEYIERWGLPILAVATVLTILLFLASLVLIYIGVEYATPAWDERSVPAPRTY